MVAMQMDLVLVYDKKTGEKFQIGAGVDDITFGEPFRFGHRMVATRVGGPSS